MSDDRVSLPHPDEPMVDSNGKITTTWYLFLNKFMDLTGATQELNPAYEEYTRPIRHTSSVAADANTGLDSLSNGASVLTMPANETSKIAYALSIPRGYDQHTALHPVVMWCPSNASAGDVVFKIEYIVIQGGNAIGAHSEIRQVAACPGTANMAVRTLFDNPIPGDSVVRSSVLSVVLYRMGNDAADTYGSSITFLSSGVFYQRSLPGSKARD